MCRYKGSLNEATCLQSAIDGGLSSHEFINLVDLLCTELRILLNMEESVTRASGEVYQIILVLFYF